MEKSLAKIQAGRHLSYKEMELVAKRLFHESVTEEEIESVLRAMMAKGETAEEVAALAAVMRSFARTIDVAEQYYMDNCGTGGDGINSFNISTTSAFVLAGAGVAIAKHGNRKISSATGSQDVLDALGIHTHFTPETMQELLEQEGIAFLFAPTIHPRLKKIGAVRQKIGKPTIFNLVGPLTNPVQLKTQFTGINRPDFIMEYASVLQMLGRDRAIVVSGAGGMDEASLAGQNEFVLVDGGNLLPFTLTAEDVGLQSAPLEAIKGGNPEENAAITEAILRGERGPKFDVVVFNSGIALFANGQAESIEEGIHLATQSILTGQAMAKLEAVRRFSAQIKEEVS